MTGPSQASFQAAAAWFRREDWDEIKRLCVDDLQDTFDEWLSDAETGVAAYTTQGFMVEKVTVTPEDIRRRQRSTGRKVDAKARADIATRKLVKMNDGRAPN